MRPRYMTQMRSANRAAVDRSWVIIEHCQASSAKLVEDREDAGPDRDVEHRDGLVRDEELRLEHEAGRDRDSLPLPSGELVGKPVDEELRGSEPDTLECVNDAVLPVGA